MCGCGAGTAAAAGAGATAGAAGTGGAGAFGPAAAAGKASVNRSVAMISRVKSPIFFMYSSSSAFRLGRSPSDSYIAPDRPNPTFLNRPPATPAQYSRRVQSPLCKTLLRGCRCSPLVSPPQPAGHQQHEDDRCDVQLLNGALQPVPMLPKQIPRTRYHGHPNCRAQKIE